MPRIEPKDISWEEAMESETLFFKHYDKAKRMFPKRGKEFWYEVAILSTDRICFHPDQFVENAAGEKIVEQYHYANYPFPPNISWFCPICGYICPGGEWFPRRI